jgi:tetratricopeptide (TPR) repeat protein
MELEQLKNSVGDLIAMTSFVSTTKNREVAIQYAGYGEHSADHKPVIFETCIDESVVGDEQLPFADISHVSHFKEEDEVLLCMSTVMRIDSVELIDQITWIRLRMCRRDVCDWQTTNLGLVINGFLNSNDENVLLLGLGITFGLIGDYEKAEQALHMVKPFMDPAMEIQRQIRLCEARVAQMDITEITFKNRFHAETCELQKLTQSLIDLIPSNVNIPDVLIQQNQMMLQFINKTPNNSPSSNMIMKTLYDGIEALFSKPEPFSPSSMAKKLVRPSIQMEKPINNPIVSMKYDELRSKMGEILPETSLARVIASLPTDADIMEEGGNDRAIESLRDTLLKTPNDSIRINLYTRLIIAYREKEDWLAVIECCQNIIHMQQLAPNAASIVRAHMHCGDAFSELGDLSEALLSYTNALELQHQHHPPQHPLTGDVHIKIGDLFEKLDDVNAALESYQTAISLGLPGTASEAYQQIGFMHMSRRKYDVARSNFIECLEIQKCQSSPDMRLVANSHICLARIEHWTDHHQKRDFHIEQALMIADSDEQRRGFIMEQISSIQNEVLINTQ